MDERVKRMLKKGCPTEDIRLWAGMAHRVVELTGPMDTPEDLRIELFLHDDSAFRLLDMCDVIDERFEAIRTENERLRELAYDVCGFFVSGTINTCELCDCLMDCENHPATSCRYGDKTDAYMAVSNELYRRMRELGIEVDA